MSLRTKYKHCFLIGLETGWLWAPAPRRHDVLRPSQPRTRGARRKWKGKRSVSFVGRNRRPRPGESRGLSFRSHPKGAGSMQIILWYSCQLFWDLSNKIGMFLFYFFRSSLLPSPRRNAEPRHSPFMETPKSTTPSSTTCQWTYQIHYRKVSVLDISYLQ